MSKDWHFNTLLLKEWKLKEYLIYLTFTYGCPGIINWLDFQRNIKIFRASIENIYDEKTLAHSVLLIRLSYLLFVRLQQFYDGVLG